MFPILRHGIYFYTLSPSKTSNVFSRFPKILVFNLIWQHWKINFKYANRWDRNRKFNGSSTGMDTKMKKSPSSELDGATSSPRRIKIEYSVSFNNNELFLNYKKPYHKFHCIGLNVFFFSLKTNSFLTFMLVWRFYLNVACKIQNLICIDKFEHTLYTTPIQRSER